ncbi:restriction endonuclease subunit S [Candidatus Pacearchaeota archaeon]|nr:restriction endonuclease subunit S [Candidatus Pacearchaeota archaeon]
MAEDKKLPKGWEWNKVQDVAKLINGYAFKSNLFNEDKKGLPLIRIRDLQNSKSNTYYSGDYKEDYLVAKGDFLMGMDGEFKIYEWKGEMSLLNQRVCKLTKFSEKIIPRYIFYLIQESLQLIEDTTPFVTVKHISSNKILNIKIPVPPIQIQKEIVEILEQAERLNQRRERANEETSSVITNIFYEMFGDPTKNDKKFPVQTLKEVVANDRHSLKRGPFGGSLKKEIFVKDGYKVYEQQHAIKNNFDLGEYYITKEKYEDMLPFAVKEGDILVSCSGTIGKIAIAPKDVKHGIINQALLKITVDRNKILQIYLKYFLESVTVQRKLFGNAEGSGIKNVASMDVIKKTQIPVPPILLQNKFAELVEKVEKIKEHQQKTTNEINTLFDALMQKAFNGELKV